MAAPPVLDIRGNPLGVAKRLASEWNVVMGGRRQCGAQVVPFTFHEVAHESGASFPIFHFGAEEGDVITKSVSRADDAFTVAVDMRATASEILDAARNGLRRPTNEELENLRRDFNGQTTGRAGKTRTAAAIRKACGRARHRCPYIYEFLETIK
jgi:hypothetical protein